MVADIMIRETKPTDVAAIGAINAAGWPGVAPLTLMEIDAIAAGIIRCWVAEKDDAILGYLIAYAARDEYAGEEFAWLQRKYATFLYIDQIAVAPHGRREGAGSALYRVAADYALARGFDSLTCEVNVEPPNPVSLRFHHTLGFQDIGVLHTRDGRTVALLRLDLSTARQSSARDAY